MFVVENSDYNTLNPQLLELFTSRVRIKILNIFLPQPEEMFYVRQVTRMVGEEVNAVRRELERMKAIGLLTTEQRANRLYYRVRKDFPFYYDLLRIVGRTTGIAQVVMNQGEKIGKIKYFLLATRFVQNIPAGANEIDMLLVGRITLDVLQGLIRDYEQKRGHEVNYTVMTEDEFQFRKQRNDAFVRSILTQPHVVVVGDEMELNRN